MTFFWKSNLNLMHCALHLRSLKINVHLSFFNFLLSSNPFQQIIIIAASLDVHALQFIASYTIILFPLQIIRDCSSKHGLKKYEYARCTTWLNILPKLTSTHQKMTIKQWSIANRLLCVMTHLSSLFAVKRQLLVVPFRNCFSYLVLFRFIIDFLWIAVVWHERVRKCLRF